MILLHGCSFIFLNSLLKSAWASLRCVRRLKPQPHLHDIITSRKSKQPSCVSVCNIEEAGNGLGTKLHVTCFHLIVTIVLLYWLQDRVGFRLWHLIYHQQKAAIDVKQPRAFGSIRHRQSKQLTGKEEDDDSSQPGTTSYTSRELNFIPLELDRGKLVYTACLCLVNVPCLLSPAAPDFIALWAVLTVLFFITLLISVFHSFCTVLLHVLCWLWYVLHQVYPTVS